MGNHVFISLVHKDSSISIMQLIDVHHVDETVVRNELSKFANDPGVVSWRIIDPSDIPLNRTYRKSWRDDGKKFYHHLPTAIGTFTDSVKQIRNTHLEKLDVLWSRSMAKGDLSGSLLIERKRQALRDLPVVISGSFSSIGGVHEIPDPNEFIEDTLSRIG